VSTAPDGDFGFGAQLAAGIDRVGRVMGASATLVAHVLGHVDRLVDDVLGDAGEIAREGDALYKATTVAAGQVSAAVRAAPRFGRIVREVVRVVAAYRLHEKKALLYGPEAAKASRERLDRESAERLYELCVELRGGVLKLGQFVSGRVDLLPPAYVEALSRLQDRVPAVPWEPIRARIEGELGAPVAELFRSIDPEPLAAASLAQVHAAVLADGTEVVVKVQVPGIEELVEIDLAAFRVLARTLGDLLPKMDLPTIADELSRAVREELDYEVEAKNAADLRERIAGADVVVPRTFPERSSKRVLTLERLVGERLADALAAAAAGGEAGAASRDRILGRMLDTFCAQVLVHGIFHADPHPGNFLVLPGDRIALLDFGCVMRLAPERRRAYAELTGAILAGDAAQMATRLEAIGFGARDGDPAQVVRFAELLLDTFRKDVSLDMADLDPQAQLARALELARDNPIVKIPQDFVLLGRVFGSLGGLYLHHRPRIRPLQILLPHLAAALSH
jgi:ubiquinone biosynthesis protein